MYNNSIIMSKKQTATFSVASIISKTQLFVYGFG